MQFLFYDTMFLRNFYFTFVSSFFFFFFFLYSYTVVLRNRTVSPSCFATVAGNTRYLNFCYGSSRPFYHFDKIIWSVVEVRSYIGLWSEYLFDKSTFSPGEGWNLNVGSVLVFFTWLPGACGEPDTSERNANARFLANDKKRIPWESLWKTVGNEDDEAEDTLARDISGS